MSADVESRLYRAESWMNRARDSADHRDGQFIFYWIALNALYGQRGSESGPPRDRENLHTFLGRIGSFGGESVTETLATLTDDAALILESEFLYEDYWIGGYTDALVATIDRATRRLRSWPNRDFARDLINVFDRLATLRNQIVHGSSKDDPERIAPPSSPASAFWPTLYRSSAPYSAASWTRIGDHCRFLQRDGLVIRTTSERDD